MHETAAKRVIVWGSGAVGKLVAARLQLAGFDVTVKVRRTDQASQLRERGIALHTQAADYASVPVRVAQSVDNLDADLVIVTVKSFDTLQAAKQIAQLNCRPHVLSLQNGIGNLEELAAELGNDRIFGGVTTYGATSLSDVEVAARGEGELVLGSFLSDSMRFADELAELFANAGWNARVAQDMQQEVWKKALVNIGINPVTAIHRAANGEIVKLPELRELASAAVQEAEAAAFTAGILTADEMGKGITRMLQVCTQTAANRSSMLQDIDHGRKTEIDALNGRIVQLGEACGIDTPVNRELVRQIKNLEQTAAF